MDVRNHNRDAWDRQVGESPFTQPVSPETIAAARRGAWQITLTDGQPVPRDWFPELRGARVLCLAGGGGQQGPVLSAAGAQVTVFDNSPRQLAQDRLVAEREGLELATVEGDMRDLSVFVDQAFDLIVHPISNQYVPEILPVWAEAFRVLRPGGLLLAGFINPVDYIFDRALADQGTFQVRFALPYSDVESLSDEERATLYGAAGAVEFSHTLEEQLGGQLAAGFLLCGFYEDRRPDYALARYMPTYCVTRALRPL